MILALIAHHIADQVSILQSLDRSTMVGECSMQTTCQPGHDRIFTERYYRTCLTGSSSNVCVCVCVAERKLEKPPHTHAQLDDLHEYRDDLYSILYKRCILHSADIHDIVLESLSEIVLLCMHDYYSNYGT